MRIADLAENARLALCPGCGRYVREVVPLNARSSVGFLEVHELVRGVRCSGSDIAWLIAAEQFEYGVPMTVAA